MPSPLAHITAGFVIYRIFRNKFEENKRTDVRPFSVFLIIVVFISILPDMDSIFGLVMGDLGRYHNNGTHSLAVSLVIALMFGLVIRRVFQYPFGKWFITALLAYETHIIMDYFTIGRGVMLFWPFSDTRFSSPVLAFYGFHWSDGLVSSRHLVTFFTELVFFAIIFSILRLISKIKTYQEA